MLITIAAGLSIHGVHVLKHLRHEVFEARRLNQYQLGTPLGSGGMGQVFAAEHRLLKRPCAVKLIGPDSADDRSALARFEREVKAAARLSHPNVVEIYDYGHSDNGAFYYVMEHLNGLSLDRLVREHGPVRAGRVIYLLKQICDGLAEAHAVQLIHRDLKPANIFVARVGQRYGVAKLLDFGLVKDTCSTAVDQSHPNSIFGTPLYMAPEQATASKSLDHRADLYAVGGIAYYLLTGQPPFHGDTPMAVMVAHLQSTVVPPSLIRGDVPADLEQVVLRCLAKEPGDRFADADRLGLALNACAAASDWDVQRARAWWQA